MKSKVRCILLSLLCLLQAARVMAQEHNMAELRPVLERLKALKQYSYESRAHVVFPNGQTDDMTTQVSMDKSGQRLFYSNKGETLLLNNTWLFKLSHTKSMAQVFKLSAYRKMHKGAAGDIQALFKIDMMAMFIDSVICKQGRLASADRKEGMVTYKVLFPAEASLKELQLVYNEQKQLPERIYLKMVMQQPGKTAVSSEVSCSGYTTSFPDKVFDEHNYFSIEKGRPVLSRNKNYKVYSAL